TVSITAQGPTSFCQGDSVILSATPGLTAWQWYRFGNPIAGATSQNFIVHSRGNYYCIGSSGPSCETQSNSISVYVPCITIGSEDERLDEIEIASLEIYPNPNRGFFTVTGAIGTIEIYAASGQKIWSREIHITTCEIDLQDQPAGLYTLLVRSANGFAKKRMVIEE